MGSEAFGEESNGCSEQCYATKGDMDEKDYSIHTHSNRRIMINLLSLML